jgi:hypothetical protein
MGKVEVMNVTAELRIIAITTNITVFCNGYKYIAFKVQNILPNCKLILCSPVNII